MVGISRGHSCCDGWHQQWPLIFPWLASAVATHIPMVGISSGHSSSHGVKNVTIPGLAAYYSILVSQVLAIRERTPQVCKPHCSLSLCR
eukprot:177856-Chlamydomonas_euryale.AAC.1